MLYAGFGKRFIAMMIDSFLVSIVATATYWIHPILSWIVSAIGTPLYFILMEGGQGHATLGKAAMGIIVTDLNGRGASYGQAAGRYFGKILSGMFLCIGYLMAAFTQRHQALHDFMASTLVLDAKAAPAPAAAASIPLSQGPRILGIRGEFAGRSLFISPDGTMLGRDPIACQIVLTANTPGVSRHHCQVRFNPQTGMFILNDLGSTYGTYLQNGTRIGSGQPVALRPGERFSVGGPDCSFEVR